ncbi:hypothetical protein [Litoribacter populi]|uniref:hypothetical protein n=1 Tax=Litoribacter populi TaxID=2598460 RepID=UPI001C8F38A6|nr:hypothetical protein [Litoribacter populi]
MPLNSNADRNNFYRYSAALVEKGDHVRLQDIRFSYSISQRSIPRLPFRNIEVYSYLNNIGILWQASNDPLDPDFRTVRPPRSIAVGARFDF